MALHDFKSQRLFIDAPLAPGQELDASREHANYLLNVLRMREGQSLLAFNGVDGEWEMTLAEVGKKKCKLVPVRQTRIQPKQGNLIYCFAPLKQARLDYMIQKAVEMGAAVLQPVITQHTQVRAINEKRIYANAIEAAEQCGVLNIPEIRVPVRLDALDAAIGEATQLIFCDEADHQQNGLDTLSGDRDRQRALLIGPEGGFSDGERTTLRNRENTVVLGLGPRILRADTAAVAALALIQARLGDWYPR